MAQIPNLVTKEGLGYSMQSRWPVQSLAHPGPRPRLQIEPQHSFFMPRVGPQAVRQMPLPQPSLLPRPPLFRFTVTESCDRIHDEFQRLQSQYNSLKIDNEKLASENGDIQRLYFMYYDLAVALNHEIHKHMDVAKQLKNKMVQVLPFLSLEYQQQIMQDLGGIIPRSPNDINRSSTTFAVPAPNGAIMPAPFTQSSFVYPTAPAAGYHPTRFLPVTESNNSVFSLKPPTEQRESKDESQPVGPRASPEEQESSTVRDKNGNLMVNKPSEETRRSKLSLDGSSNTNGQEKARAPKRKEPSGSPGSSSTTLGAKEAKQPIKSSAVASNPKPKHPKSTGLAVTKLLPPASISSKASTSSSALKTVSTDRNSKCDLGGSESGSESQSQQSKTVSDGPSQEESAAENKSPSDGQPGSSNNTAVTQGSKRPYSFYVSEKGKLHSFVFPSDAFTGSGIPHQLREHNVLDHGEGVCSVAISQSTQHVYTAGKGCVKIWNLNQGEKREHLSQLDCAVCKGETDAKIESIDPYGETWMQCMGDGIRKEKDKENYLRSCKLFPDGQTLIVGGHSNVLTIWDLASPTPQIKGEFAISSNCYSLAITPDAKACFSSCADGNILMWDVQNQTLIREFHGHKGDASSIALSLGAVMFWSGGLDKTVRAWDIRKGLQVHQYDFESQVFCLAYCRSGCLAVGLEGSDLEVINVSTTEKYQLYLHKSSVLSMAFSKCGKWFVSTGKDCRVNLCRSPHGAKLCLANESSSVICSAITADSKYVVTGSGDKKATVYEVVY